MIQFLRSLKIFSEMFLEILLSRIVNFQYFQIQSRKYDISIRLVYFIFEQKNEPKMFDRSFVLSKKSSTECCSSLKMDGEQKFVRQHMNMTRRYC